MARSPSNKPDSKRSAEPTAAQVAAYLRRHPDFLVRHPQVLDGLKPPAGCLGRHRPDEEAEADIARGIAVLSAMSAADVGQAVVVQQGMVLGVEAIEGTDALIERCGALRREGAGGVLVKLAKRNQERRADLPAILAMMADKPIDGMVMVELDSSPNQPIAAKETAAIAKAYLQKQGVSLRA